MEVGDNGEGWDFGQNLKKGVGYIGGLHKLRGLGTLCQL